MSNSLWLHGLQHTSFPVHHQFTEPAQTHVHRVGDALELVIIISQLMWGILRKPACLDVGSMTVGEWRARVCHSPTITCWGCDTDWPALGEMQRHWKKNKSEKEKVSFSQLFSLNSILVKNLPVKTHLLGPMWAPRQHRRTEWQDQSDLSHCPLLLLRRQTDSKALDLTE